MDQIELVVQPRTVIGKHVKKLRREGVIPLVVYGRSEAMSVQAPEVEATRAIAQAGGQLIALSLAGESEPRMVLAREVQRDVLNGRILHADLYEVDITERIQVTVPLSLTGEPALVVSNEAVLMQALNEVEIECLPTDILQVIEVDISALADFGDAVYVGDVSLPDGIDMITAGEEMVVRLDMVLEEEEEEEEEDLFGPAEPGEVEVIGREAEEEPLEDE